MVRCWRRRSCLGCTAGSRLAQIGCPNRARCSRLAQLSCPGSTACSCVPSQRFRGNDRRGSPRERSCGRARGRRTRREVDHLALWVDLVAARTFLLDAELGTGRSKNVLAQPRSRDSPERERSRSTPLRDSPEQERSPLDLQLGCIGTRPFARRLVLRSPGGYPISDRLGAGERNATDGQAGRLSD
jgi:hypothetical protein